MPNNNKLQKRKQYNRRKARSKRDHSTRSNGPYNLGTIKTVPIQTRAMRYLSQSNDTEFFFRVTDLLSLIAFSTSSTQGYSLISAIKLSAVKIHAIPDSSDLSGGLTFTWLGQFAPNNEKSIMYANAVPASMTCVPPQNSVASWWLTDTTDTQDLFSIILSTAVPFMMDLHFEYVMPHDDSQTTSLSLTSIMTGRIFYPSIPRNKADSTRLRPVGLYTG
jgi:hypothetical protein